MQRISKRAYGYVLIILTLLVGIGFCCFYKLSVGRFALNSRVSDKGSGNFVDQAPEGTGTTPSLEQGKENLTTDSARIIFLHRSTGEIVWKAGVVDLIRRYNTQHHTQYEIREQEFPTDQYGWENLPYDYWNIWVNHGNLDYYKGQPTLKTLTKEYDLIIFKHCFPVGNIEPDDGKGDVTSKKQTLANYKLQYAALKQLMHKYSHTKFIVWTGAVPIAQSTTEQQAKRQREFVRWVKNQWDKPGDNIYIFDFYELETDGGLYLKPEYAQGGGDSHPNDALARKAARALVRRIIEILQDNVGK